MPASPTRPSPSTTRCGNPAAPRSCRATETSTRTLPAETGRLVGILTRRDLRFLTDNEQRLAEVMTKDALVTAPEHTTLSEAGRILTKNKVEKLLLVDEKHQLRGLITIKDIDKMVNF